MRKQLIWQNTVMVTMSFFAGVAFFQLFTMEQAMSVLALLDERILSEEVPTIKNTIIPVAIFMVGVVLFATHPYFFAIAKIVIALKACFVGFSSVYLLAQRDEIVAYGTWWFPFQFVYIILMIILCERFIRSHRQPKKSSRFPWQLVVFIVICLAICITIEIFVISTIFK